MKSLISIFFIFLCVIGHAAESSVQITTLPPVVYLLTVNSHKIKSENLDVYGPKRYGIEFIAAFRSEKTLKRFMSELPIDVAKTLAIFPAPVPRSELVKIISSGQRIIIDPRSEVAGGEEVILNDAPPKIAKDSEELSRMFAEDQADRLPSGTSPINWDMVRPRDDARRARILKLYTAGNLQTKLDYYHAAFVMHHGSTSEEYLLALELSIIALAKGESKAKWLVAATEDRFLISIGRKQRWGTQLEQPFGTDGVVTDRARKELHVPELSESATQSEILYDTAK